MAMKILLAGASGAMGQALIPRLIELNHQVVGLVGKSSSVARVDALGAIPVVVDALDAQAVEACVEKVKPQVVINQLTAIPGKLDIRHFDREFALTNRLRTEGTANLMTAAVNVGCEIFVAQSFAGWPYARTGRAFKTEDDEFDPNSPSRLQTTLNALRILEDTVLSEKRIKGIVLRYGAFYGPHTSISVDGAMTDEIRGRRVPLVGAGTGVWSFVHIYDAATATVAAVTSARPGVYNIVDDDPAPVAEWLPILAKAADAKPPFCVPSWLARLLVGEHAVAMMTETRGVSNAKAKRDLAWAPKWSSWRQGFEQAVR